MILNTYQAHVGNFGNFGPWVHLSLADISPPGYDILEVLKASSDRKKRMTAWRDAMATFDAGRYPFNERAKRGVKVEGVSVEAEPFMAVPHDMAYAEAPYDTAYAKAMRFVFDTLDAQYGEVVPFGSRQAIPSINICTDLLIDWNSMYHPKTGWLRFITPCQAFYQFRDVRRYDDVTTLLDKHAAYLGTRKSLTVFVCPEVVEGEGAGTQDDYREADNGEIVKALIDHPMKVKLVHWFKASTSARASKAQVAYDKLAASIAR